MKQICTNVLCITQKSGNRMTGSALTDNHVKGADRAVMNGRTIAENLMRCTDQELIALLRYIRDENGEKVNLIELKHYLRKVKEERSNGAD